MIARTKTTIEETPIERIATGTLPRVEKPGRVPIRSWAPDLEGKALPVRVQVLFGHGDRYAVQPVGEGGPPLAPGMNVVIEGAERIMFPGQPLMVQSEPATQPAEAKR